MGNRMTKSAVDAAIDADDETVATALADLLDANGAWDWTDDAEDRFSVVESSGAWWLVYRGTESDEALRFASRDEAMTALADRTDGVTITHDGGVK